MWDWKSTCTVVSDRPTAKILSSCEYASERGVEDA